MNAGDKEIDNCLFCRIINGDVPAEFILEEEEFIAIRDIYPKAPVHVLVIPRQHIHWLNDIGDTSSGFNRSMLAFIVRVAEKLGVTECGYRVIYTVGSGGGEVMFLLQWPRLAGESAGFNIAGRL